MNCVKTVLLFNCLFVYAFNIGLSRKVNNDHDSMYDPRHSQDEGCSENEDECCPCDPDKNVQMTLRNIYLQYPVVKHNEYCRILKRDYKVFDDYVTKCDSKGIEAVLENESEGIEKYIKKECNGHMSHEPKCDKADKAQSEAIKCHERFANAVYYIMKNIPAKDQIALYCCIRPHRVKCVSDSYNKYCNKKFVNVMMDRYSMPGEEYSNDYCTPQREKVCKKYPKEMKQLIEINQSSMATGRSGAYVWYKSHLNNIQADCYTYE